MIKSEKGNCSIVGAQNEVFLELATIMLAIREKMGDEKGEKFVRNAFFIAGSRERLNLSAALVELFKDKNSEKKGDTDETAWN